VRGTIIQPPASAEPKPTHPEPTRPDEPEKLPTVDSRIPGRTEFNPEMGPFPNVKRSYWKDGKLAMVVDKLPERSWTPNEIKDHSDKFGPYYGTVITGASGAMNGVNAGKYGGLWGAIGGGVPGGIGGGYVGWRTGPHMTKEFLEAFDQKTDVQRYGDILFKKE